MDLTEKMRGRGASRESRNLCISNLRRKRGPEQKRKEKKRKKKKRKKTREEVRFR